MSEPLGFAAVAAAVALGPGASAQSASEIDAALKAAYDKYKTLE